MQHAGVMQSGKRDAGHDPGDDPGNADGTMIVRNGQAPVHSGDGAHGLGAFETVHCPDAG